MDRFLIRNLKPYTDFILFILSLPQTSVDFALDALAGDFVSSTAAPVVKSAVGVPTETPPEVNTQVQFKPFLDHKFLKPLSSIKIFLSVFVRSAVRGGRRRPGCSVRHLEGHHTRPSARPSSCQRHCQGSQHASKTQLAQEGMFSISEKSACHFSCPCLCGCCRRKR